MDYLDDRRAGFREEIGEELPTADEYDRSQFHELDADELAVQDVTANPPEVPLDEK